MTFGFTSASANGDVDKLADAIYADFALKRGSVSSRRVAAFVTARSLLDDGHGSRPSAEDTLAVASWLTTGRVDIVADDDDEDEEDAFDESDESEVLLRDWWAPVRLIRRRRA
jgi:hypothetical protein